jgi:SAM-dependent methyltransferase
MHGTTQSPPVGQPTTVTPPWLANRMLDLAGLSPQLSLLDPCAGTGTILMAAVQRGAACVEYVELNEHRALKLAQLGFVGTRGDMHRTGGGGKTFDVVAMNPDFREQRWLAMVTSAYRFVAPGGVLVAAVPGGWYNWLGDHLAGYGFSTMLLTSTYYGVNNLPEASFAMHGHNVLVSVLTVRRGR